MKYTIVERLVVREVTEDDAVPFDDMSNWRAVATVATLPDWDEPSDWRKVKASWTTAAVYANDLGAAGLTEAMATSSGSFWDEPIGNLILDLHS